jgi:HEAT repeat protein
MENKKLDKNIETNLFSANTATVIATLNTLKERGNNAYLPLLFDLLNSNPEAEIETEILFILNNLKIEDAVPVLAEALQNPKYLPIRKKLTAACWENGLDYKNYLPVFVDLVIHEDWDTGFESFTVIENMKSYPEQDIIAIATDKIRQGLSNANEEKKYFLHEILTLIR